MISPSPPFAKKSRGHTNENHPHMGMILICVASTLISDFGEIEKTPKRAKRRKNGENGKIKNQNKNTKKTKQKIQTQIKHTNTYRKRINLKTKTKIKR